MNTKVRRTICVAGGLTGAVVVASTKMNEVKLNRQVEAALRHIRLGAAMAWQASLAESEQRTNMLQPALHALDRATALTLALVDTTKQSRVIKSELGQEGAVTVQPIRSGDQSKRRSQPDQRQSECG